MESWIVDQLHRPQRHVLECQPKSLRNQPSLAGQRELVASLKEWQPGLQVWEASEDAAFDQKRKNYRVITEKAVNKR